ncbi:MAG: hypothetical protein KC445_17735 [Anaerolineales bacterium]|nr:hypothetical protein [Anaerolineales bacterium]
MFGFAPGQQAVEGEASEDAAGGDGGGEVALACAPLAGRDAVDHGYDKPN